MRKASLLLLAIFTLAVSNPAHALLYNKKAEPAKTEAVAAPVNANDALDAAPAPLSREDVAAAAENFRNLPRAERAERMRSVKEELRSLRRSGLEPREGDINTLLLVIIAILLPPLAVGLYEHGLTKRFWIDLLLWLLFYIPGLIYALIVIL